MINTCTNCNNKTKMKFIKVYHMLKYHNMPNINEPKLPNTCSNPSSDLATHTRDDVYIYINTSNGLCEI